MFSVFFSCFIYFLFQKVDFEERGDEFDQIAATLRKVATARLPQKEVSFTVANVDDMSSLTSRFQVRKNEKTRDLLFSGGRKGEGERVAGLRGYFCGRGGGGGFGGWLVWHRDFG